MSPRLKHALHWVGGGVALSGTVFVTKRLVTHADELDLARYGAAEGIGLLGLAAVYGAANLLLARAWWRLLSVLGVTVLSRTAVRIYGISQLAKYVPGNIFQFAGRQALGLAAGLPGWVLAKSVLWELALISSAGATFGILAIPLLWTCLSSTLGGGPFLLVVGTVISLIYRVTGQSVSAAYIYQLVFLLVSGLVFVGALAIAAPPGLISADLLLPLCGAYCVAWLAGLVTPGAPAGVGVREAVILFLLGDSVPGGALVVATVLGRIVTVLGDTGFFVWAWCIKRDAPV